MGRRCVKSTLLLALFFIGQVTASPVFYWSQPDCIQQNTDYSYGQPTYQETMRDMVEETIKAICDIMRVAAQAAQQELSEIAKIFYRHYQNKACPDEPASGYPGESVGEIYITTSDPQYEVTSTQINYSVENAFENVINSTTTKNAPTEKEVYKSTEVPSSSSNCTHSTSAPLEETDLTTVTFTTTEDTVSQTANITDGTTEFTSPTKA